MCDIRSIELSKGGKKSEIYATLEGAGSVGGGTLVEGALDEDVGVFRIIETRFGEYFFTSVKNSFISKGPQT
jgi:hypothetical protein